MTKAPGRAIKTSRVRPPRSAASEGPAARGTSPRPERRAHHPAHPKADLVYLTRTFGRWQIELYQRAVHLTRQPKPDPDCQACKGGGGHGYVTPGGDGDWIDCHCLDRLRTWSLRLWPRRNTEKEYPF